jgi:hypothetical protein
MAPPRPLRGRPSAPIHGRGLRFPLRTYLDRRVGLFWPRGPEKSHGLAVDGTGAAGGEPVRGALRRAWAVHGLCPWCRLRRQSPRPEPSGEPAPARERSLGSQSVAACGVGQKSLTAACGVGQKSLTAAYGVRKAVRQARGPGRARWHPGRVLAVKPRTPPGTAKAGRSAAPSPAGVPPATPGPVPLQWLRLWLLPRRANDNCEAIV